MPSLQEAYKELITLTKQYLTQEYTLTDRILSEGESYSYFAAFALQQRRTKQEEQQRPLLASRQETPDDDRRQEKEQGGQNQLGRQDKGYQQQKQVLPSLHQKPLAPSASQKPSSSALHRPIPADPLQPTPSASGLPSPSHPISTQPSAQPVSSPDSASPSITKSKFQLEQLPAIPSVPFEELRKIIQEKLPRISWIDQLPDDAEARKEGSRWNQPSESPQVWILSLNDTPKQLAFLMNVIQALAAYGVHAQIGNAFKFEQGDKWKELFHSPKLQLFMISSTCLHQLAKLKKYHKEDAQKGTHYLDERPLLLLSDLDLYLKEPALKSALWSALKQILPLIPRP